MGGRTPQRRHRWKLAAAAAAGLLSLAVAAPLATADVTSNVPHMLGHVLDAVAGVQTTADAIKAKTDTMPTTATDTFQTTESTLVRRDVAGMDGKQFLANVTVHCSFGTPDGNTDLNTAAVSMRLKTPTGGGPFFTTFREQSTDRVVTVVTGPVAGFDGADATYYVSCNPGGTNSFSQGMGQAWFEVLP